MHVPEHNLRVSDAVLDAVCSKLVPDQATEGDGVAKKLQTGDWIVEDDHGSHDEQNILQNSGKCEYNSRSLADLGVVLAVQHAKSAHLHTKNTTETFSMKATAALAINTRMPTR